MQTTITTKDNSKQFVELLNQVKDLEVYVGIPEEKSSRKGEEITNAELCYIHTNGSPLNHIPARPIIEPAIETIETKEAISKQLEDAVKATLENKRDIARQHLKKAGMIGKNAARAWFTDPRNNWPPNSIATAKAKLSKNPKLLQKLIDSGADITAKEISRPLIDTGELRKSIIYVIK